jgi:predicted enzyme related to lactoylglutathione lyase
MTPQPNFVLLYVDSPRASETFYSVLLGRAPVESSANFVLFVADSGLRLGLWARGEAEPKPSAPPGGAEVVIAVEEAKTVNSMYASWAARGLSILQPPTDMDFGRTFVALDPDGHRLRVFAPKG